MYVGKAGFDLRWMEDGHGKVLAEVEVEIRLVVSVIKIEDP